jgi:hypothetical protein
LCQARATLRKSLALGAIVRTRREPRHEFAPCGYPISSIFRCNLRTATDFSLVTNRISVRGPGDHQMSPGSNPPVRRERLE